MKYGVKVWKLPKIRGIISRILEVTTIALYTICGSTCLGSPYCGKLPFRELVGTYQDSGKENEITNSRLRVFSVVCNAGFALHWIFFIQLDRKPCKLYYKKKISKTRFWQNCSVAKMLRFAVLSAVPCAMMSKMHVLKNAHGARNTAWDSDFVSCHHENEKKRGKSRLRTLPLLQISPLLKYCVLQYLLNSPVTGQSEYRVVKYT